MGGDVSGNIWGSAGDHIDSYGNWFIRLENREQEAWREGLSNPIFQQADPGAFDPNTAINNMTSPRISLQNAVFNLNTDDDWNTAIGNVATKINSVKSLGVNAFSKANRWSMDNNSQLRTDFNAAVDEAVQVANDGMNEALGEAVEAIDDVSAAEEQAREESEYNANVAKTEAGEVVTEGANSSFDFSDAVPVSGVRRPTDVLDHASVQASLDAALGMTGSASSPIPSRFFNSATDTLQAAVGDIIGDASKTDLLDLFTSALTEAKTVLNDADTVTLITNMVTSFEDELTPQLNRAFNRFAGGMVDINAVEGSAFLIGMSNIERENVLAVTKFRNELTMEIFRSSYDKFITSAMQMFQQYLEFYLREKLAFVGLYEQSMSKYIQTFSTLFSRHLETYTRSYNTTITNIQDIGQKGVGLTSDYVGKSVSLLQQGLNELFKGHIEAKLQTYGSEDKMLLGGTAQIADNDYKRISAIATDAQAAYTVYNREIETKTYYNNDLLRRRKERNNWRLDTMLRSANVLVAGKANTSPGQAPPSQGEKALAGAAVGAEVGASVGGTKGAAIGSGIGFAVGYFS